MDSAIYILTGYTGVGKTKLSLDWAKENNAELISCDSLLVYKHMNIGTAKPSATEMAEVPHHLIDVVPPASRYSIIKYVRAVKATVADIHGRGKRVLVVGGSGFYLNAFFSPVADGLVLDPYEESRLQNLFKSQPLETSVEMLCSLNPEGLGDLDVQNPRRVIKAWIRCVAAGKSLARIKAEFDKLPGEFDAFDKRLIILTRPSEELENRIRQRVDTMIDAGLIDEVKKLLAMGLLENPSAANSIGYRETIAFLRGELPESKLAETICVNTRRLVKKQRTWFKKFLPEQAVVDISRMDRLPDNWHVIPARIR